MAVYFVCPLCGRQRPVAGWDPFGFRDEIILRDGRGRGYGRGFEYNDERTAEDSIEIDLEAMARRCLVIVDMCLDTGMVSADDLIDDLPSEIAETLQENATE